MGGDEKRRVAVTRVGIRLADTMEGMNAVVFERERRDVMATRDAPLRIREMDIIIIDEGA